MRALSVNKMLRVCENRILPTIFIHAYIRFPAISGELPFCWGVPFLLVDTGRLK
jgi:hypothetical protein